MEKTKFSAQTPFHQVKVGDTILIYCENNKKPYTGVVGKKREGCLEADMEEGGMFRVGSNEKIWVVKELSLKVVSQYLPSRPTFELQYYRDSFSFGLAPFYSFSSLYTFSSSINIFKISQLRK